MWERVWNILQRWGVSLLFILIWVKQDVWKLLRLIEKLKNVNMEWMKSYYDVMTYVEDVTHNEHEESSDLAGQCQESGCF